MINLKRLHVYIEGVKYSYDMGRKGPIPEKEFPFDALAAYVIRVVKEMLSPNSLSTHTCVYGCKQTFAIIFGRTDSRSDEVTLIDAVPR